jgi:hypothetical protein
MATTIDIAKELKNAIFGGAFNVVRRRLADYRLWKDPAAKNKYIIYDDYEFIPTYEFKIAQDWLITPVFNYKLTYLRSGEIQYILYFPGMKKGLMFTFRPVPEFQSMIKKYFAAERVWQTAESVQIMLLIQKWYYEAALESEFLLVIWQDKLKNDLEKTLNGDLFQGYEDVAEF